MRMLSTISKELLQAHVQSSICNLASTTKHLQSISTIKHLQYSIYHQASTINRLQYSIYHQASTI